MIEQASIQLLEGGVYGLMIFGLCIAVVFLAKLVKQAWEDKTKTQEKHQNERIDDRKEFVSALHMVGDKITESGKKQTEAMNAGFQRVVDTFINHFPKNHAN